MSPTRYRVIYLLLGLALALVVIGTVILAPHGTSFVLPPAVESISPGNHDVVQRQIDLTIDMAVGYDIELFVDDVHIPPGEVAYTPATGRYVWRPGPASVFAEWTSGLHDVRITYERVGGTVDVGDLEWTFRVQ